jgi:hypothetical protein
VASISRATIEISRAFNRVVKRPARPAKPGRQIVAAGDRQCGAGADQITRCDFVGGIAHGEISGDRNRRDLWQLIFSRSLKQVRSSGVSRPWTSCPPGRWITGSLPRASARPSRARSSGEKPIITSAARPPWPSTSALVASVVDRETSGSARPLRRFPKHRFHCAGHTDQPDHDGWSAPWPRPERPRFRCRAQHRCRCRRCRCQGKGVMSS